MHEMFPCMHASLAIYLSIPVSRELTRNNMYQNMLAACMHTITHTAKWLWQHAHICTGTRLQYAHNQSHTLVHDCSMMHTYTGTWLHMYQYMVTACPCIHMHQYMVDCSMHTINRTHWYMTVACTHVTDTYFYMIASQYHENIQG